MTPQSKEWFDEPDPTGQTDTNEIGLRFECTQCGKCCTGPTGFVLFTDTEAAAMAKDLGVTTDAFIKTHTRQTIVGQSLKETVTKHGYDCVLLDRDKNGKALCKVYKTRPEQCQTWPFWRSNLDSLESWKEEAEDCPGMDTGPLHTTKHIRLT
ncbi:MAG: YkgJ family cysteine cluster protein, partial [Phycisphaerales bacterium]|nr:YkgJ family cysteine cluster protein [Phycisphaerales bacterium]